ncbi:hypothetical protein EST38_g3960 [Candolleomyces aberdarensis]|uniref:F-box domain-containing protein n=1 Tax=Candolleomyces aberdarensis TaxID=2316362 RepID=A0A4Q2DQU2_9AGAR|nr:hypothetical protein EST38_g3960 [Candolleomyces aberdarensis]
MSLRAGGKVGPPQSRTGAHSTTPSDMPGDLPAELWLRIVDLIPDDHYASLFWVNRAFYQLATERKYRHLVLDDDRPSAVLAKLERIDLETSQFAIPEDVTLADRLLAGLSGLQNVNELAIEWMMASTPEISFCFPLLTALFQSLGQQLTTLTLRMGLDQLCQLAENGPVLGSLQELSLHIGRSELSEIRPEDAIQNQEKLASFINGLSPTLRKLSLSSSDHVRLEPPYLDLVFLPHLRSLAFHLPFDSYHIANPRGLNAFLKLHTGISELSLIPCHCCKRPPKSQVMDTDEWLQEVFSGVDFEELRTLELGLNTLGGDSRVPPVARSIGTVASNLSSLTITGVLTSVEDLDAILRPFTKNGNSPPKKVVLEVHVLSRQVLETILKTLPNLETLDLTYRWGFFVQDLEDGHHPLYS